MISAWLDQRIPHPNQIQLVPAILIALIEIPWPPKGGFELPVPAPQRRRISRMLDRVGSIFSPNIRVGGCYSCYSAIPEGK